MLACQIRNPRERRVGHSKASHSLSLSFSRASAMYTRKPRGLAQQSFGATATLS